MHYFHDFKGFSEAELNLFKPLTVLIGPNGSGKSNTIEAIELFSFIVHGRSLHEVTDVGKGGVLEIRGGLQSCPHYGHDFFSFAFSASIKFERVNKSFSYSLKIQAKPQPRVAEEKLSFDDGMVIFQTMGQPHSATSGDIKVEYNNFARGGRKPLAFVSCNRSVLSQYNEFAEKNNKKYAACAGMIRGIMEYLRSSFVFDPNPKLMRTYERIGNNILSRDGANLSAVLYALSKGNEKERQTLNRLLNWIKQLPEEPYQDLDFVTTPLSDVIFGFKEDNQESIIDARMLSDGTLRCLAVLTAIETVAPDSRVVIEEFDNGLHPSRVHILMEAIADCCKRRKLNILVTTHNPATLNALQPEQLDGVVLCAWISEQQAFKLVRLSDLPRYDELLERGRLGDLITRRVIDQYLAPGLEKARREKALAWLQKL